MGGWVTPFSTPCALFGWVAGCRAALCVAGRRIECWKFIVGLFVSAEPVPCCLPIRLIARRLPRCQWLFTASPSRRWTGGLPNPCCPFVGPAAAPACFIGSFIGPPNETPLSTLIHMSLYNPASLPSFPPFLPLPRCAVLLSLPPAALLCCCRFEEAQQGGQLSEEEVEERLARLPPAIWHRLYK